MSSLSEFVDAVIDAHMPVAHIMMIEAHAPDPDIDRVRTALTAAFAALEKRFGDELQIATAVLDAIPAEMHRNIMIVPRSHADLHETEEQARLN
jgi:hypothetical protein